MGHHLQSNSEDGAVWDNSQYRPSKKWTVMLSHGLVGCSLYRGSTFNFFSTRFRHEVVKQNREKWKKNEFVREILIWHQLIGNGGISLSSLPHSISLFPSPPLVWVIFSPILCIWIRRLEREQFQSQLERAVPKRVVERDDSGERVDWREESGEIDSCSDVV